jgi:hypothetical protein
VAPPEPTTVDTFDLHDRTYRRGDPIVVLPSAPRHRDGFVAKVIGARFDPAGTITGIDVFGAPGSKAPSQRTLRPERLGPVAAPRKSRHRKEG